VNRILTAGLGLLLTVGIAACSQSEAPKTETKEAAAPSGPGPANVTAERLLKG